MKHKTNRKPYKIIPWDPSWANKYRRESQKIKRIFNFKDIRSYHIGSTSVPGISGKPTIDILFVLKNIKIIKPHKKSICQMGYTFLGARNTTNTMLFEKIVNGSRNFIIHFYPSGHPEIKQIIAIRKYLRNNHDIAQKYSQLKLSLYKKYPNNYQKYRSLKDKFMQKLIGQI